MVEDFVIESGKSRLSVTGDLGPNARRPLEATLEADLADARPWLPGAATGRLRASSHGPGLALPTHRERRPRGGGGDDRALRAAAEHREGHLRARLRARRHLDTRRPPGHLGGRALAGFGRRHRAIPRTLASRSASSNLGVGPPPRAVLRASFEGDARRWLNQIVGEDTFESRGRDASVVVDLAADAPRLDALRGEIRWTASTPC